MFEETRAIALRPIFLKSEPSYAIACRAGPDWTSFGRLFAEGLEGTRGTQEGPSLRRVSHAETDGRVRSIPAVAELPFSGGISSAITFPGCDPREDESSDL